MDRREERSRRSYVLISLLCGIFLPLSSGLSQGVNRGDESQAKDRFHAAAQNGVKDRYIVVLEDQFSSSSRPPGRHGPSVPEVASALARLHAGQVLQIWEQALPGFLVELPAAAALALSRDPRVRFVEQDAMVDLQDVVEDCVYQIAYPGSGAFPTSPQSIPCANPTPSANGCFGNWGLDRIDDRVLSKDPVTGLTLRNGSYQFDLTPANVSVHVYTLDTGITPTQEEFKSASGGSRVGTGVNASAKLLDPDRGDFTDCVSHGHGTHVFGILGGKTYGVAKDVVLHAVRANKNCGSGVSISSIVEGVNWILQNHDFSQPGVVNMSVNGTGLASSQAGAIALAKLINSGISFVESAGNQNASAAGYSMVGTGYPQEIIVVGGMDERDGRWLRSPSDASYAQYCPPDCGSNYGSAVDVWAPASHIVSASRLSSNGVCWLSGTSMAAPHVTGAAALLLARFPKASPSAVEKAVKLNGTAGALTDPQIGAGEKLLNARFPTTGGPVAGDDRFSTPPNTAIIINHSNLLAGDFDWDRNPLSIVSFGAPSTGQLQQFSSQVRYTPPAGFTGIATFTYTVTDGQGNNDTATVRVAVENSVQAPVAGDDYFNNVAVNQTVVVDNIVLFANDSNPAQNGLNFEQILRNPTHGSLGFNSTNQRIYQPSLGFVGMDNFTYRIQDPLTLLEADATVYITIGNHAPTATVDSFTIDQNTSLSITFAQLLANDTDPDGDALNVDSYDLDTPHGANNCCNPAGFTYTPDAGFAGTEQFSYKVSDRLTLSGLTATATVVINVRATQLEGTHDTANCTSIAGWAWDRLNPSARINVNIYDGGTFLTTVTANQYRGDLLSAGIGDGYHGFSWTVPDSLKNGQPHAIRVKFASTGTDLGATPKSITCYLSYEGVHDQASCTAIAGWAWSPAQPNTPVNVDIYDGVTKLSTVPANLFRQDLFSAGKGNGYHGFVYTTPSSLRDGLTHSIKVTIEGTQNALGASPKSLLCANSLSGYHDTATCSLIEGWAWDSTIPNTPISVDIYDGSTLLMTVPANLYRADLASSGKGNGVHGFSAATPVSVKTSTPHTITVKAAGTTRSLQATPRTVTCPP
jgi:subtilisin family serine protease